jgi:hypothetical protein
LSMPLSTIIKTLPIFGNQVQNIFRTRHYGRGQIS